MLTTGREVTGTRAFFFRLLSPRARSPVTVGFVNWMKDAAEYVPRNGLRAELYDLRSSYILHAFKSRYTICRRRRRRLADKKYIIIILWARVFFFLFSNFSHLPSHVSVSLDRERNGFGNIKTLKSRPHNRRDFYYE